jgi:hypothetical protein
MFNENILTPFEKLLDSENIIIFNEKEREIFDVRDPKSLFNEGINFWPGTAGVHHSNGLIIIQKNINSIDLPEYLSKVVESIKFPATSKF